MIKKLSILQYMPLSNKLVHSSQASNEYKILIILSMYEEENLDKNEGKWKKGWQIFKKGLET